MSSLSDQFNTLEDDQATKILFNCCASTAWVNAFLKSRPIQSDSDFFQKASEIWFSLTQKDWLEAFDAHPKIGDPKSLKEKYKTTHALASKEQSSVAIASDEVITELAKLNSEYENKFGFIFIVCATGKSAQEMLDLLKKRLPNSVEDEMKNAAIEQSKITAIRLKGALTK